MLRKMMKSLGRLGRPSSKTTTDKPAKPGPASRTAPDGTRPSATVKDPQSRPRKRRPRKRSGKTRSGQQTSPQPRSQTPREPDAAVKTGKNTTPWSPDEVQVPVREGSTRFQDLDLTENILHAIADLNFQYCTPIQAASLPPTLAGRDVAGRAQTGTGKTAAFLIAIFNRFARNPLSRQARKGDAAVPRALIIAPTRELVMQIERDAQALSPYLDMHVLALFGGSDLDRQKSKLHDLNPELVVATPGRLLDFKTRRDIDLSHVEIMVIDEADRMLDMGFIPDVRRIVRGTPPKEKRQTLLFSATLSDDVMRLAASWLKEPVRIDIEPEQVAVDTVRQILYLVANREKFPLLYNVLTREKPERVLMFVNRRDTAERLTHELKRYRFDCDLISGALSQNQRTRTMTAFREGRLPILVATDVAGRGIHIEAVSHVINYNIPEDPEDYVHRIGRTGRAGASGISITFACEEESFGIPPIETYIGRTLPCVHPEDDWLTIPDTVKPLPASRVVMPAGTGSDQQRRDRSGGGRPGGGRPGGRRPSGGRRPASSSAPRRRR